MERVRKYLEKGNRAVWCVFLLYAFTIFLKGFLFHWNCFHSIILSSIWHHPLEFIRFWGGKLIPALFLGSFVFISRSRIWTICVHVLIDLWLIANVFYYNANTLFLSYETMQMADNMGGFWDSLYAYMDKSMWLYPLITVAYTLLIARMPKTKDRKLILFACAMCAALVLAVIDNVCYKVFTHGWHPVNEATEQAQEMLQEGEEFEYYYPFGQVYYFAVVENSIDYNTWAEEYVRDYSILSYLPASAVYNWLAPAGKIIELSNEDKVRIQSLVQGSIKDDTPKPKTNVVFILFESLESWPIDEVCGYEFMPNLKRLSQDEHTLYCDKLRSQVRHGNSADGQMINITGLLPISNGATCRLYDNNLYPSYAHCYPNSALVNPSPGIWNQPKMTKGYHFKQLIEPAKGTEWNDDGLIEKLTQYIDTVQMPFCAFGITVSSHVPFVYGSTHRTYEIEGMPAIQLAYLNCLHFTDSVIGGLIDKVKGDARLDTTTTIVITGDHTIFRNTEEGIDAFAQQHGVDMQTTKTYTPLLVYSPMIERNTRVTDVCYQMDIYPTLMQLIGCDEYVWKGVGVDVTDSIKRTNRELPEKDAFELSEKIIRSDYFGR